MPEYFPKFHAENSENDRAESHTLSPNEGYPVQNLSCLPDYHRYAVMVEEVQRRHAGVEEKEKRLIQALVAAVQHSIFGRTKRV